MAIPSYIFGAPGLAKTPQELARQREIADALAAGMVGRAPRNVGEGLTAVGQALAYRRLRNRNEKSAAAGQESAQGPMAAITAALGGGGAFPSASGGAGMESAPLASSGGPDAYRDAIASIESAGSGDYAAVGPTHPKLGRALGRYQIMEANIGPWSKEVLGREVSPDEFMANPQIQDAIFDGKFGSYVSKYGPEGAAQAWFAGPGGVGKVDRKDVLGTDVGSYGQKFMKALGGAQPVQTASLDPSVGVAEALAGQPQAAPPLPMPTSITEAPVAAVPQQVAQAAPTPMQTAPAPMPEMAGDTQDLRGGVTMQMLMDAANNPWLNDNQSAIVRALMQQELQAQDPMRQMEMERARLELDALRDPQGDPTSAMQNYQFLIEQGVDPQTAMERAFSGGTTVNVGGDGAPGLGKLSTDYGYVLDPETRQPIIDPATNLPTAAPIPGSPAAVERQAGEVKDDLRLGQAATASDVVTNAAARAREAAAQQNFGPAGTSFVAGLPIIGPMTDSGEVVRQVDVLKNSAAAENLNAMRQASPTGGALGNVTEKELKLLSDKSGALDPNSPTFLRDLEDYEQTLLRTIHGKEAGDRIFEATRPKKTGGNRTSTGVEWSID